MFAIIFIAGILHAASLAWPFSSIFAQGLPIWWLQVAALTTLTWQLNQSPNWHHALRLGWVFATTWLTGTFWWLFISMHTYGGLSAALAGMGVLGLAAFLAFYYAVACAIYVAVKPKKSWQRTLLFAMLWLLAEMARGIWLTGFGWGASGYAHVDGPVAGYAPWLGVYGICIIAAGLAMTLAQVFTGKLWLQGRAVLVMLFIILLPALVHVEGGRYSQSAGELSVTLLQGNIPQDEKFHAGTGVVESLRWYGEQLLTAKTDLVVAPETAIPLLPNQLPAGYWEALRSSFVAPRTTPPVASPSAPPPAPSLPSSRAALVGVPLGSYAQGYTNSVVGMQSNQLVDYQYDKHHLVPFGEFIPTLFKWFTRMMNIPLGDTDSGAMGQPSFQVAGQRLALNICYEDLFGEELGARFIDSTLSPTLFVNVSNIGWFGNSVAIDQHLHISRMRALEFERSFVRATNTGATVIIDHQGRVVQSLPRHTKGVLVGVAQGRNGMTPYAQWVSRYGLWPLWLVALAVVAWAARNTAKLRRST